MDLETKAERLLQKAYDVLEDESVPENRRNWLHYNAMQKYCVISQMRFTDDSSWQLRSQEWGKRKEAANKAMADDELKELRALIERLQANSTLLRDI